MKMKMMIGLIVVSMSACSSGAVGGYDVAVFGTTEGIAAYHDGLNALITNGKQSPDTRSAAWANADMRQVEETNRQAGKKSLFKGLFGNSEGK